ncbi:hypothetical protein RI367_001083 [Sorochytrium milnesiophthora]
MPTAVATPADATSPQDLKLMAKQLKDEIKKWEKEFEREQGRKPGKQDVYEDADVHDMYKLYNKIKSSIKEGSNQKADDDAEDNPAKSSAASPPPPPPPPQDQAEEALDDAESAATTQKAFAARPDSASARMDALRKHQDSARKRRVEVGKITQTELKPAVRSSIAPAAILTALKPDVDSRPPLASPASPTTPSLADALQRASSDLELVQPTVTQAAIAPILIPGQLSDDRLLSSAPVTHRQMLNDSLPAVAAPEEGESVKLKHLRINGELVVDTQDDGQAPPAAKPSNAPPSPRPSKAQASVALVIDEKPAVDIDILEPLAPGQLLRGSVYRTKIPTKAVTILTLVNETDNKVLLSARREMNLKLRPTYYIFDGAHASDMVKEQAKWKIRGKAEGAQWSIIEAGSERTLAVVNYSSATIPRAMMVAYCPPGQHISPATEQGLLFNGFDPLKVDGGSESSITILKNRMPKFNDALKTYCLNFGGRVTLPSVKNFQLMRQEARFLTLTVFGRRPDEPTYLQFGRVGKETFTMDMRSPMYALVSFAIAASTFDAIEKV